ncbi:hypothetical protein V2J09_007104 [Rumex salicifolius]
MEGVKSPVKLNIDELIERLLAGKNSNKPRKITLSEGDIRQLCVMAKDVFLSQPMLLELQAPLNICGDIHGQFSDLVRLLESGGFPPETNYLFMGDYVDRGKYGIETICLLFAYKIKYPQSFFLLRGNHECASINRIYGFYDECKRRYSVRLWKVFTDCFNCLPAAAIIEDKIICMHGGISPVLDDLDQIKSLTRPVDVPDQGLLCDLLWSDPDRDVMGWAENDRGVSYTFGPDRVEDFLKKYDLDLICRAHQVVEDGYEFFADRQLVTIFSAPNYCGEFNNAGAMMSVDSRGGSSSSSPQCPHYSNLHLAYFQCLKFFAGEKFNFRKPIATNIIKNHDFSEGLNSWNPISCTSYIASYGGYAVLTNRTEWWSKLSQDITSRITPGLPYTVSAIVAVSGTLTGTAEIQATLQLENHDSTNSYLNFARIHMVKDEWGLVQGTFVLESLPKAVFFYLEGPVPGLDMFIKSVMMCPVIKCIDQIQTQENVIVNHQFDDGVKNWSGLGCDIKLCDTLPEIYLASDKVFAAAVNRTREWNGIEQDITGRVHRKLVYEATADVRIRAHGNNTGSANVKATLRIEALNTRTEYVPIASVQATDSSWTELQGKFLINSSPTRVVIYIQGPPLGAEILLKSLVVKLAVPTPLLPPPPIQKSFNGVNIIENSELNNGIDAWFPHGKCKLSVGTGSPHILPPLAKQNLGCHNPLNGRYILVNDRLESWMGPALIITEKLKLFMTYQASAWIKIGSGLSGSSGLESVNIVLSVDNQWVNVGQVDVTGDQFHEFGGSFRIEEQPSKVMVIIHGPSSGVDLIIAGLHIFAVDREQRFEQLRREADKIRKRDVVLKFTGDNLLGSFVKVKQATNSFPLGSCISRKNIDNEDYVDFFVNNFNCATFQELKSHVVDEMINLCQENNIELRGHCNFWEEEWTAHSKAGVLSNNDLTSAVQTRLELLLARYKGKFKNFDMNNKILYRLGDELTIANMFKTAREHDPNTVLFVNDYHIKDDKNLTPEKYINQITELLKKGARVGGIGISGHMDSPVGAILCSTFDKLGILGLPLWITGLTVSSINDHVRADDLEVVLREAFAHPAVDGVMLSGFWKLFMEKENSHLVNAEGSINEAGKRLIKVKEEWMTDTCGHIDERGELGFRGFHGSYEVEVFTNGKRVTGKFIVDKDDSPLVVHIDI